MAEAECSQPEHVFVILNMIAMGVRVHDNPDRLVRDLSNVGHDLVVEHLEVVVDQKQTIVASLHRDVSASSGDNIDLARDSTGDHAVLDHVGIARIVHALEAAAIWDCTTGRNLGPLHCGSRADQYRTHHDEAASNAPCL